MAPSIAPSSRAHGAFLRRGIATARLCAFAAVASSLPACGRVGYELLSGGPGDLASSGGARGAGTDAAPNGGGAGGNGGSAPDASGTGGRSADASGGGGAAGSGGTGARPVDAGAGGSGVDAGTGGDGDGAASTGNTPPLARILVTPGLGEPSTVFAADSAGTTDREDPPGALSYAWDWESDGTFDDSGATATHSYASAGTYTAVLRVTDTGGLSGYATFDVVVVAPGGPIVVTTSVDESDAGATPASPGGTGLSLREALTVANLTAGRQSILVPSGMVIALASGLPATSDGSGVDVVADGAVIDGGAAKSVCVALGGVGDRWFGGEIRACGPGGLALTGTNVQVARAFIHDNGSPVNATGTCHFGPDNEVAFQNEGLSLRSVCVVERNRFHDCAVYGIHGVTGASGSRIQFNAAYRNAHGVSLSSQTSGVAVVHNVFVSNSGGVSGGGGGIELGGAGHTVRNNVLAFNGTYGLDARSATGLIEGYDAFFSNATAACGGCTPANETTADPAFIDRAGDDFRLLPGSALIDAGLDLGLDVNGPKPGAFNGVAPDIGRWEAPSPY